MIPYQETVLKQLKFEWTDYKSCFSHCPLTNFWQIFPFYTPQISRKPKVFWCFPGICEIGKLVRNWLFWVVSSRKSKLQNLPLLITETGKSWTRILKRVVHSVKVLRSVSKNCQTALVAWWTLVKTRPHYEVLGGLQAKSGYWVIDGKRDCLILSGPWLALMLNDY